MRTTRTRALTLVEILVVAAIVLLLAGITLEVMVPTKKAAKRITCVSNLHQLGLAIQLYQADFDGRLPLLNGPVVLGRPVEHKILNPLAKYGASNQIFFCPEYVGPRQIESAGDYSIRFTLQVGEKPKAQLFGFDSEPNRVIAFCQWHLTNPIQQPDAGYPNGKYVALRESGSVQMVESTRVKMHTYNWGGFTGGSPDDYLYLEFPGEPFPPVMTKLFP